MSGEIFNAIAVLGGLGVFSGLMLGVVAHFFGVREDPRVEEVLAALPGANCGGCGFAGCADYARAIVLGGKAPDLCAPGGNAAAQKIAALLGMAAEARIRQVALVFCNGGSDVAPRRFAYNGIADCAAAALVAGGDKACHYGCLGLGSCARVCPAQAIEITAQGIALVHPELCIGCGKCIAACPRQLIQLVPENAEYHVLCRNRDRGPAVRKVCAVGCIGCGLCAKAAPNAIRMEGALAVMNYQQPLSDPTPLTKCPQKTIAHRPGYRPKKEAPVCA